MFAYLSGKLAKKDPAHIVLDVNGVGYLLSIALSTYADLPELNENITLETYLHVREDILEIYGFSHQDEKKMFLALISVSGIGPKVALNIVSHLRLTEFQHILSEEDSVLLQKIPGVGKKMASRIMLELKDKFQVQDHTGKYNISSVNKADKVLEDSLLALISLGYKKSQAQIALNAILNTNKESLSVEQYVRLCLQKLSGK